MIPPNTSLVKYDNPVLISKTSDKKSSAKAKIKAAQLAAGTTSPGPVPVPSPNKSMKHAP